MVANSFFGLSNSLAIIAMDLELLSKPSSMLVFVNEKIATSAPEIKAEQHKSKTKKKMLKNKEVLVANEKIIKREGSGSKINCLRF